MSQSVEKSLDLLSNIKKRPENYLFHYTRTETALDAILISNTIRFSPLTGTNDLEETRRFGDIHLIHDGTTQTESMSILMEAKAVLPLRYRSASFCSNRMPCVDEPFMHDRYGFAFPRMWATYGANHKGVCLVFYLPELRKAFTEFTDKNHLIEGSVRYMSDNELVWQAALNKPLAIPNPVTDLEHIHNHIVKRSDYFFFRKQFDWRDECEYRFIYYGQENAGASVDINFGSSLVGMAVGNRNSYDEKCEISAVANFHSLPCFVIESTGIGSFPRPLDTETLGRPQTSAFHPPTNT